jgi:hypothetical protein
MQRVAQHRGLTLGPLRPVLIGYPDIAQSRWLAWLRKQRLVAVAPAELSLVLEVVTSFADPVLLRTGTSGSSDRLKGTWI